MPDLRETVARVAFETEVGYAPDDRAWERAGEYWLGFADKILAIPELTRPTADLGEDGELVERLRTPLSGSRTALVMEDGTWRDPLRLEAADRLILYREALVAARPYVEANASRDSRMTAHHKGADVLDMIDAVLSRSGG